MKSEYIFKYIYIDEYSATPKYLQICNSILKSIEEGKIQKDDILPSINELSFKLEISRDTGEKAYKHLKKLGILESIPGKGYFISNSTFEKSIKVFLLFNKLSAHKKIIYDSFVSTLGEQAIIDLYIYNNDFTLFKKILLNKRNDYSHYVIIPQFIEGGEKAHEIINENIEQNLILLDKIINGIKIEFGAVYENFERDIYNALEEAVEHLQKYSTIKLIFPINSYYPKEIQKGLIKFCQDYAFNYKIIADIAHENIESGDLFINVMEEDLVVLIEKISSRNLISGKDVGIISYNETPLKKIILNGITTISTDFQKMGEYAAKLIIDNSKEHLHAPFRIYLRPSI
jgi:DNA-binding transcriptional regulator YhcF (GntR family)